MGQVFVWLEFLSPDEWSDNHRIEARSADEVGGYSKCLGIVAGKRDAEAIAGAMRLVSWGCHISAYNQLTLEEENR